MTEEDIHNGLVDSEPIDRTLKAWFAEYATETRRGPKGTEYHVIPSRDFLSSLEGLALTLVQSGYTYEDLYSNVLRLKLVNTVWKHKKIVNMSAQEIRGAKENLDDTWQHVIAKFSDIKIVKVEPRTTVEAPNKGPSPPVPSTDPSKLVKVDTSGFAPILVDDDFMAMFPDAIENKK